MYCPQKLETDLIIEIRHEGLESAWGAKVIACCEDVAGVNADADAGMVGCGNEGKETAEVGERATDGGALAAHGF